MIEGGELVVVQRAEMISCPPSTASLVRLETGAGRFPAWPQRR